MWLVKNFLVIIYSLIIAVISLIIYPFDYRYRISGPLLKIWANAVLIIWGVKVDTYGKENINRSSGKIYISNHLSYLDIFVQLAKIPDNLRMIYKKEINRIPLLGLAMMATGFIPIDRKNIRSAYKSLDKAAEKIKKGISVVIYPEGTRSKDGKTGEFKRGMFVLADKSQAEIIPVSLSGTRELMPPGTLRVKSGKVNMVIGEAVKYRKDKNLLNDLRNIIIKNIK
ncbi:MAG: 1-acyl-sn-glycerol-3-phosphate acyltransferase [Ignavibacteria bacterium]|nr:1-acyl-sn-glycerol-3-phosphate acyltransferase [Ignavibacteria bacterium]